MTKPLTYAQAGVDIASADAAKEKMAALLATDDRRVLNRVGAFASLIDGQFPGYRRPILVMKSEEPGSKQKIALAHERYQSICEDLIHHLINDVAVMGAVPFAVQDTIVCGKLVPETITALVGHLAAACRAHGCALVGGETSEQPGVLAPGTYVLTACVVGVAEYDQVIDGRTIVEGDVVLGMASNGLHTNGYTLVRALLDRDPGLQDETLPTGERFLDAILRPHRSYLQALRPLFGDDGLHGLAHITGGGIAGNLNRILPAGLDAAIRLSAIDVPPLFSFIRNRGAVPDADMLRTFNLGVGMTAVVAPEAVGRIQTQLSAHRVDAVPIGTIVPGSRRVGFSGELAWVD